MQNSEVKRLAFIRYMYKVGVEQSYQPEPVNALALLSFHDAAELFLHLSVEHLSASKRNVEFMDYWNIINQKIKSDQLTQKDAMNRLNKARVQLKHYGTAPSKLDIEAFRVNITNFFDENTPKIFEIDFDSVSLVDLVVYDNTKSKLKAAQDLMQNNDVKGAIKEIAASFEFLIHDYEQQTLTEFTSPFYFGQSLTFDTSFFMHVEGKMGEFVDKVNESISAMQTAIKVMSLGFDYRRYSKFKSLTPNALFQYEGDVHVSEPSEQITMEGCKFCFDYVIECALRLQDFDYNL